MPRSIGLSYKYYEGIVRKGWRYQHGTKKEQKEKLENAESKEEAKKILKDADVELTDTELDHAAGGEGNQSTRRLPF